MKKERDHDMKSGTDNKLMPLGSDEKGALTEYDEGAAEVTTSYEKKEGVRYEDIFDGGKKRSLAWSVASMVLGIFSIVYCIVPFVGLLFSTLAIALSVVARKKLKYFDGMAIAGLILGIFGAVIGITVIVLAYGPISEMYEKFLSQIKNDPLSKF